MSILNLTVSGFLTKDPVSSSTKNGKDKVTFSIGCNRGYGDNKSVLFFNCEAYGKSAENISKYFSKGDEIIIEHGEIKQWTYEEKKYSSVLVLSWEFGKMKKDKQSKPESKQKDNEDYNDNPFDDENIPF